MRFLLVATVLAGCSGDTPAQIDANPAGPKCSMQVYDLCLEEHDCTLMICQNFASAGFQVCSQPCDASNPCPADKSGAAGTCELGVCRPSAPNMCHL